MIPDQKHLTDELFELLDRERRSLLSGDLRSVERLAAQKETLIGRLKAGSDNADGLNRLQEDLSRNMILLEGAMTGIRNVSIRLEQLRRARSGLDTYDSSGRKSHVATVSGKGLEKRA